MVLLFYCFIVPLPPLLLHFLASSLSSHPISQAFTSKTFLPSVRTQGHLPVDRTKAHLPGLQHQPVALRSVAAPTSWRERASERTREETNPSITRRVSKLCHDKSTWPHGGTKKKNKNQGLSKIIFFYFLKKCQKINRCF